MLFERTEDRAVCEDFCDQCKSEIIYYVEKHLQKQPHKRFKLSRRCANCASLEWYRMQYQAWKAWVIRQTEEA